MKLKHTPMCLLMMAVIISIINGETSEMGVQTPSDIRKETQRFTRLEKLIDLGEKTLDTVKKIGETVGGVGTVVSALEGFIKTIQGEETSTNEILKQQHNDVMQKLAQISTQITEVQHAVDRGFEKLSHNTAQLIQTNTPFYILSVELSRLVESINRQYEESRHLIDLHNATISTTLIQESMENFVRQVFELNPTLTMLRDIHSTIFKGKSQQILGNNYLGLFADHIKNQYSTRCNTNESPNQQLHQIYLILLATELKATDILSHGYEMRTILRNASYNHDIDYVKSEFRSRVISYRDAIKATLPSIARDIRRCNVPADTAGSVYQLDGYVRFIVENEFKILKTGKCVWPCPEYSAYTKEYENAITMDPAEVCPAPDNSGRKYDWIRTSNDGKIYGKMKSCKKQVQTLKSVRLGDCCTSWWDGPEALRWCETCGITKFATFPISTTEKLSNINSNMVITSVRLAIVDGVVEFLIKQGQLAPEGNVKIIPASESAIVQSNVQRDQFNSPKRHMYLDDVFVDPGYAVTGLRFKLVKEGDGFKINVRGTKYNYATGTMDTSDSKWFDPEDPRQSSTNPNYRRDREIITSDDVENPIHATFFNPLESTNQKVRFNNTSVLKDAGQVTVPLLDGQEVYMRRPIVLTGVGLFYKSASGYGGFIAPRIFTESFHEYIN